VHALNGGMSCRLVDTTLTTGSSSKCVDLLSNAHRICLSCSVSGSSGSCVPCSGSHYSLNLSVAVTTA
jgi:hypothetical protein